METIYLFIIFACTLAAGIFIGGMLEVSRRNRTAQASKRTPWMTRNQMEVLDAIRKEGSTGVDLWGTDMKLSTIRSLEKRGLVDTRSGGRVVATKAGKKRLNEPWPDQQPVGDQNDSGGL